MKQSNVDMNKKTKERLTLSNFSMATLLIPGAIDPMKSVFILSGRAPPTPEPVPKELGGPAKRALLPSPTGGIPPPGFIPGIPGTGMGGTTPP